VQSNVCMSILPLLAVNRTVSPSTKTLALHLLAFLEILLGKRVIIKELSPL